METFGTYFIQTYSYIYCMDTKPFILSIPASTRMFCLIVCVTFASLFYNEKQALCFKKLERKAALMPSYK